MISKIKHRLASEQGFTLIELLVVIVILGILVAIAVPSYLSFTGKAKTVAAESNVRTAIPAAQAFYTDTTNNLAPNTFSDLTGALLRTEAPGLPSDLTAGGTTDDFCIQDTVGGQTYYYDSGAASPAVTSGTCPGTYTMT